jgi:RNA polymerase sigma factor (TIGR02999 family)
MCITSNQLCTGKSQARVARVWLEDMSSNNSIPGTAEEGEPKPAAAYLELCYTELRRLAQRKLALEPGNHTMQATALADDAYMKLARQEMRRFNNRSHFIAAVAEEMRRIMVDQARRRKAQRRGGNFIRVEMTEQYGAEPEKDDQLLALDEALEKLTRVDPLKAEVVKLRYFAGLNFAQTAGALCVSEPTAKRYWSYARAWLSREMLRQQQV